MTASDHARNAWGTLQVAWDIDARNQSIHRAVMRELSYIADEWGNDYDDMRLSM